MIGLLRHDPVAPLLASGDEAVACFTSRDLGLPTAGPNRVGRAAEAADAASLARLWDLPEVRRLLKGQEPDGSWASRPPGRPLLETWRRLRYLVDQYEMTRDHPAVAGAAEYLFSCQTDEGDIRGLLANQLAPYYTGAMLGLLIKAGYASDPRVERGMLWLLDMRQDDGGWVIGSPGVVGAAGLSWRELSAITADPAYPTMREFDRSRPFSAAGTGMVLRAFAAHPGYRRSEEALRAGRLLASKLLEKDNWSYYGHPDNWIRFQFPFWWTNLVSALATLSVIGLPPSEGNIGRGLAWLAQHQEDDGLWKVSYSRIHKATMARPPAPAGSPDAAAPEQGLWVSLAICRVLARFSG